MSVQTNIRRVREAKGIKQKAVADYLNISPMRYSRIEGKNKSIDSDWLPKIADFLGVEVDVFFDQKLTDSVIYNLKPIKTL